MDEAFFKRFFAQYRIKVAEEIIKREITRQGNGKCNVSMIQNSDERIKVTKYLEQRSQVLMESYTKPSIVLDR